jgi:hypothetical protein
MPPEGFEPAIPANERPQTYALGRAATATGKSKYYSEDHSQSVRFAALSAPAPTSSLRW